VKVPQIPKGLFKHGIKPGVANTEKFFNPKTNKGVHLCGFDVETVGASMFKSNDLYTVQLVFDHDKNSHIFLPAKQGVENLNLFFSEIPKSSEETTRVYATAHNASFDIGALLGKDVYDLMKGYPVGDWVGKVVEGNSCFALLFNKEKKQRLTIADSMAWHKSSLKNIAKNLFGENDQKLKPPEYLGLRTPTAEEAPKFFAYAEKDAQIQLKLTKNIYDFCREGGVKLCLTPAQLAGRVFKKDFLKDRLFLPNTKTLPFICKTYHGAVFTAFGRGFFPKVNYYDINSLYPYATINVPLNFSNTKLQKISLEDIERGFVGFIGCKFKFPDKTKYPCLPQLREIRKFWKLTFPVQGTTYCTTEEIKLALSQGCEIENVYGRGWYPTQGDIDHPLGEFMKYYYAKKEELDKIKEKEDLTKSQQDQRYFYKLLLNSLIGKFCQRNRNWLTKKEMAGSLFKPEFGSLILSKSRAIINDLIAKNGAIYSDTDCLLTKHTLETGTKIGQLKNELGNSNTGDLLSIRSKLYFVTDEGKLIKCAKHGFRLSSQDTFDHLLQRKKKMSVAYAKTRMVRLKEGYIRNRLPRRMVNQTFKIQMRDDGKREYDEQLKTVNDLLTDHSDSRPLQNYF